MVYFIQNLRTKAVKIGISESPRRRLSQLRTGHCDPLKLLGVIPGAEAQEKKLHDRFAKWRLSGEWFRGDEPLLGSIEDIIHGDDDPPSVWDECLARGKCRQGLVGLDVMVWGNGEVYRIGWTCWQPWEKYGDHEPGEVSGSRLILWFEESLDHEKGPDQPAWCEPADLCNLVEDWPRNCPCCRKGERA